MAVRCRFYPTRAQELVLEEHCAHARFMWNLAVEQRAWWRPGRPSAPGYAEQCRQLTAARAEHDWLRAGSRSVQEQALRDFDHAMGAFFGGTHGMPSWRSRRGKQGFVIRDTQVQKINRRWGAVYVPKSGWVRFRATQSTPEKLSMARVTRDCAGRWHVSFPGPQPAVEREASGKRVGIDRGIRTALVTSDGQHYRAPQISDRRAARYLALQQRTARQHKKSRKRERTRRALGVVSVREADRRKNWAEKISTRFVRTHDMVVLENLNVNGMVRRPKPKADPRHEGVYLRNGAAAKTGLNRGIRTSCWGVLARRLAEKATASDVRTVFVPAHYTSQQCHACGHTAAGNRESQAVFRCQSCGHEDHADRNAARNILARGLLLTTGEIVPAHAPGHGVSGPQKPVKAAAGTAWSAA